MYRKLASVSVLVAAASCWLPANAHEHPEEPAEMKTPVDEPVFFDAATAEVFKRPRMHSQFMLTAAQSEGRYTIVKEKFLAGFSSYNNPHKHSWHSEVFVMLSGEMEWTVNGETAVIGPGDMVYIPPRATHATRVIGDSDVEAVMIYEPGGYENNYFKRFALTPEQMKDQELIQKMMSDADVIPVDPESMTVPQPEQ